MAENVPSVLSEREKDLAALVDTTTRERIGSLSAHGVSDIAIAEMLLLDPEQVIACHGTEEFKKQYAKVAQEDIDRQIDLDEGWDAVETKGIEQVLTSLQYNRDPKFALAAAAMANKALRKKGSGRATKTIDASETGQSNVIILNMNKTFINNVTKDGSRTLQIEQEVVDITVKKHVDLPSPKQVGEMLAPVISKTPTKMDEMSEAFKAAGVVFDKDE